MDDEWDFPYLLGPGYGSTLSHVPQDLPKEKVKQKQRIGFHSVKAKSNGRRVKISKSV